MNPKLEENQIHIIQLALEHAKDHLKSIYKEPYLSEQLQSIDSKLTQQMQELNTCR